jgi:hypothetical protein
MATQDKLIGLDEPISLAGRVTTIRQEFNSGKAIKLSSEEVRVAVQGISSGEPSTRSFPTYRAFVERDDKSTADIPITEAAYRELVSLGQPSPPESRDSV